MDGRTLKVGGLEASYEQDESSLARWRNEDVEAEIQVKKYERVVNNRSDS